jgi:hypothetical protein
MDEGNFEYEEVLQGLYYELEKPTVLSVLLIEQIAQGFFWIKRHTQDKESLVHARMINLIRSFSFMKHGNEQLASQLSEVMVKGRYSEEYEKFEEDLKIVKGITVDELRSQATSDSIDKLKVLDDLIHRHVQNLRHLQKSLDAIDFKKRIVKKMDLELERIEAENAKLLVETENA